MCEGEPIFSQRENPAVYGVNESLCDSFASRRNSVPADSSEIEDFRDTRIFDSGDVDETLRVSFAHQKSEISGDVLRNAVRF